MSINHRCWWDSCTCSSTRDSRGHSDGCAWVSSTHTSQGNLQWRSEMTTWYFRDDKAHRVTPEKHLWEVMCSEYQQKATHRVFVKGQARRSWAGQHEVPEKTWEWPQGWQSRSKQPTVTFQKATGESRACFLWQGVGGVVLCSGDLLEGTDWKSKYAFHLCKTGLHPHLPSNAVKDCTPYRGLSEASDLCWNKANEEHWCHWTCILGRLAMRLG